MTRQYHIEAALWRANKDRIRWVLSSCLEEGKKKTYLSPISALRIHLNVEAIKSSARNLPLAHWQLVIQQHVFLSVSLFLLYTLRETEISRFFCDLRLSHRTGRRAVKTAARPQIFNHIAKVIMWKKWNRRRVREAEWSHHRARWSQWGKRRVGSTWVRWELKTIAWAQSASSGPSADCWEYSVTTNDQTLKGGWLQWCVWTEKWPALVWVTAATLWGGGGASLMGTQPTEARLVIIPLCLRLRRCELGLKKVPRFGSLLQMSQSFSWSRGFRLYTPVKHSELN